jgi:hypothetical protein
MGEFDGGGTVQFWDYSTLAGGPGPTAARPAARRPHQGSEQDHQDVEHEDRPGVSDEIGHVVRLERVPGSAIITPVGHLLPLAQVSDYWFAGILTIVAAIIVTAVILTSSRSDHDEAR